MNGKNYKKVSVAYLLVLHHKEKSKHEKTNSDTYHNRINSYDFLLSKQK